MMAHKAKTKPASGLPDAGFIIPISKSALALHLPSMDETPYNHPDADKHKRNAEPLTHVEEHVALEIDLDVLQELDADA